MELIMKTNKLNEEFKKATKAQKRVMIAKDVLAQIKLKRYFAESGEWVRPLWSGDQKSIDIKLDPNSSIKDAFKSKAINSCRVCALGGLFMSCTNLNNNTTVQDLKNETYIGDLVADGDKISNGLNRIFTQGQLMLIESYFEGGEGYFRYDLGSDEKAETFLESYNDDERLKIIMQNIIDNNGTFKPSKLDI
jgi:hypothetical protein